jgi:DNA polymerase-3 subunit delta'
VSWRRLRGHQAQVEAFERAVQRGRLAHAYLFAGPRGVGKRTFAVELARALLCERRSPAQLEACGSCPACIQVAAGTHPDFVLAARPDEAQEFPIDLVRQLSRSLALKSARGRSKVVILDQADDLNEAAANCFLKTLEEPPPGSILVLVGTSSDRQLGTIVSRCQVVRFAPLPDPLVEEVLTDQGITDPSTRARLARLARGSPGLALEWAETDMTELRSALLRGLTAERGPSPRLARTWMDFVEAAGKEMPLQRRRARAGLRLLIDFLADTLALQAGHEPQRSEPDDRPLLESLASRTDSDELLAMLERCLEADRHLERNVQVVLALEALLDTLAQLLSR